MKSMLVFIVLAVSSAINCDAQQSAFCDFGLNVVGNQSLYACNLRIPDDANDEITELFGYHLDGFSDADVREVIVASGFTRTFPRVICSRFAALTHIFFDFVNLEQLFEDSFSSCREVLSISLIGNSLESIPVSVFASNANLEQLSLTRNLLRSLDESTFNGLSRLQVLNLGDNIFDEIPVNLFRELVNLDTLGLWNTSISAIDPRLFENNRNLQAVTFALNAITDIRPNDFSTLTSVTSISFSGNPLRTFNTEAFATLRNLRSINLAGTGLTQLTSGMFEGLSQLTILGLRSNSFSVVEAGAFNGLSSLQSLNLDNCRIREFRTGAFDGLGNLTSLFLNSNEIERLPVGVFAPLSSLQNLRLWNNRLTRVSRGAFGSDLSRLIALELESNQINSLDQRIFDDAINLNIFYFSNNLCASLRTWDFNVNRTAYVEALMPCFRNYDFVVETITDHDSNYQFFNAEHPGMLVRVQTEGTINIALTPLDFPWRPMIEIFIGTANNTESVVRRNREVDAVVIPTPGVLSTAEENFFRITWANRLILVTRGNESFPFLGYMMEDFFNINFFGLRTPESRAVWNVTPFE